MEALNVGPKNFPKTCKKQALGLPKLILEAPKSSSGAAKIEPGALQDVIFERHKT